MPSTGYNTALCIIQCGPAAIAHTTFPISMTVVCAERAKPCTAAADLLPSLYAACRSFPSIRHDRLRQCSLGLACKCASLYERVQCTCSNLCVAIRGPAYSPVVCKCRIQITIQTDPSFCCEQATFNARVDSSEQQGNCQRVKVLVSSFLSWSWLLT